MNVTSQGEIASSRTITITLDESETGHLCALLFQSINANPGEVGWLAAIGKKHFATELFEKLNALALPLYNK